MNFKGGEAVKIKIVEFDKNGLKDLVDTLTTTLKVGSGQHKATWSRSAQQVNQDLQADQQAGDSGPLDYRFEVEIAGSKATKMSGSLNLTKTIKINTSTELAKAVADGTKMVLTDANGTKVDGVITDGLVTFKNVLVGHVEIEPDLDKKT